MELKKKSSEIVMTINNANYCNPYVRSRMQKHVTPRCSHMHSSRIVTA